MEPTKREHSHIAEGVGAFIEGFLRNRSGGARVLCTKELGAMHHMDFVRDAIPSAKFIFMIRDGRGNVLKISRGISCRRPPVRQNLSAGFTQHDLWFNLRVLVYTWIRRESTQLPFGPSVQRVAARVESVDGISMARVCARRPAHPTQLLKHCEQCSRKDTGTSGPLHAGVLRAAGKEAGALAEARLRVHWAQVQPGRAAPPGFCWSTHTRQQVISSRFLRI